MQQPQGVSLEIREVAHSYAGKQVLALGGFAAPAGTQQLILGPSGCGKSTLLHILAGLLRPGAGDVLFNGRSMRQMREGERDHLRGRHIGIVFQRLHLLPALTVSQNLLLAQYLGRRMQALHRIEELLAALGLGHRMHARPAELSLGEAQRVAIARAVINRPGLLLADEPTSSLDDANAASVLALLRSQAETLGATLVIVTHDARIKAQFDAQFTLQAPV